MTKKTQIVVVTTALFLTENFIQYNISKKESGENKDKFFVFPPLKTSIKMAITTGLIALLSSLIIGEIKD